MVASHSTVFRSLFYSLDIGSSFLDALPPAAVSGVRHLRDCELILQTESN
jgi:hypothetical protein